MAHGLESRVPFLDHPLVEFAATVPADVKFQGGSMKHLLKTEFAGDLPDHIIHRRDKMGFPVPLAEWFNHELSDFVQEIFQSMVERKRPYINQRALLKNLNSGSRFSRKTWGLMSLELWHQLYHDRAVEWRSFLKTQ